MLIIQIEKPKRKVKVYRWNRWYFRIMMCNTFSYTAKNWYESTIRAWRRFQIKISKKKPNHRRIKVLEKYKVLERSAYLVVRRFTDPELSTMVIRKLVLHLLSLKKCYLPSNFYYEIPVIDADTIIGAWKHRAHKHPIHG